MKFSEEYNSLQNSKSNITFINKTELVIFHI